MKWHCQTCLKSEFHICGDPRKPNHYIHHTTIEKCSKCMGEDTRDKYRGEKRSHEDQDKERGPDRYGKERLI